MMNFFSKLNQHIFVYNDAKERSFLFSNLFFSLLEKEFINQTAPFFWKYSSCSPTVALVLDEILLTGSFGGTLEVASDGNTTYMSICFNFPFG